MVIIIKRAFVELGEASVSEVLALQAREPEFNPQKRHKQSGGMAAHPLRRERQVGPWGSVASQPSLMAG